MSSGLALCHVYRILSTIVSVPVPPYVRVSQFFTRKLSSQFFPWQGRLISATDTFTRPHRLPPFNFETTMEPLLYSRFS